MPPPDLPYLKECSNAKMFHDSVSSVNGSCDVPINKSSSNKTIFKKSNKDDIEEIAPPQMALSELDVEPENPDKGYLLHNASHDFHLMCDTTDTEHYTKAMDGFYE